MIIILKKQICDKDIDLFEGKIIGDYVHGKFLIGENTVFEILESYDEKFLSEIESNPIVDRVINEKYEFKFSSRVFKKEDTIIDLGDDVKIGGDNLSVIAGPCSVEDNGILDEIGFNLKNMGIQIIRGGIFKPRTSPYSFQGLGVKGLKILKTVAEKYNLKIASELTSFEYLDEFCEYVDIIQVGARNMQNFELLKKLGKTNKPIILKRAFSATIQEFIMSAEYIISQGNDKVILCERGIRTFETYTRNTLDISCIPLIKKLTHLPIIADPSHSGGRWDLVRPLSLASVAAGAHGLLIEVHPEPKKALSDGEQTLNLNNFYKLLRDVISLRNTMDLVFEID